MKKKKHKINKLLKEINEDNLHGEIMSEPNVGKEITKEDYDQACERLEEIIDLVSNDTPKTDPFFQELDKVSNIIEAYEEEHYPIAKPTIEYRGYKGTVRWGADFKGYYGQTLNIEPDLVSYEGETLEDLEKDFQNAMDFYLEDKKIVKVFLDKTETSVGAIVDGLNGFMCVADTLDELKKEVKEGIKFHLDGLREDGNPVPEVFEGEYQLSYEWINEKKHSE